MSATSSSSSSTFHSFYTSHSLTIGRSTSSSQRATSYNGKRFSWIKKITGIILITVIARLVFNVIEVTKRSLESSNVLSGIVSDRRMITEIFAELYIAFFVAFFWQNIAIFFRDSEPRKPMIRMPNVGPPMKLLKCSFNPRIRDTLKVSKPKILQVFFQQSVLDIEIFSYFNEQDLRESCLWSKQSLELALETINRLDLKKKFPLITCLFNSSGWAKIEPLKELAFDKLKVIEKLKIFFSDLQKQKAVINKELTVMIFLKGSTWGEVFNLAQSHKDKKISILCYSLLCDFFGLPDNLSESNLEKLPTLLETFKPSINENFIIADP